MPVMMFLMESPVDFPHVPFVPFLLFSHLALHLVMMVVESCTNLMHFPLVPLVLGMHGTAKFRFPMIVPLVLNLMMLRRLHRRRDRRCVRECDSRYVQCHPTAESHCQNLFPRHDDPLLSSLVVSYNRKIGAV
jgi:hypothetical protein